METHVPAAKTDATVPNVGKSLNDSSSFKLIIDIASATNASIMDVTPALPKYILPAPRFLKEFTTTYAKIPNEMSDKTKPHIPRFDWVFSVNL